MTAGGRYTFRLKSWFRAYDVRPSIISCDCLKLDVYFVGHIFSIMRMISISFHSLFMLGLAESSH